MPVTILHAKPWKVTDKEDGQVRTGCKVTYVDEALSVDNADEKGTPAVVIGGSIDVWNKLTHHKLPMRADVEFKLSMRNVNGTQKPIAELAGFTPAPVAKA